MAGEFSVPLIGKLPMDPALGVAGERGIGVAEVSLGGPAESALQRIIA